MSPKVLVADDEDDVLTMVGSSLAGAGFHVLKAEDGPTALVSARRDQPALIVLDIMMPGMSGLEVTRVLKREAATANIPIVLLSARTDETDRVLGFELGIDDFVTKPFSPRELVLRVKSILRRKDSAGDQPSAAQVGAISLDQERHAVSVQGKRVDLTVLEYKLLTLMTSSNRLFSREELLERVWGVGASVETRTVDTHMRRLREKLGRAGEQIQTVRGFGYRLDPA